MPSLTVIAPIILIIVLVDLLILEKATMAAAPVSVRVKRGRR
jgi:hypothetical protein